MNAALFFSCRPLFATDGGRWEMLKLINTHFAHLLLNSSSAVTPAAGELDVGKEFKFLKCYSFWAPFNATPRDRPDQPAWRFEAPGVRQINALEAASSKMKMAGEKVLLAEADGVKISSQSRGFCWSVYLLWRSVGGGRLVGRSAGLVFGRKSRERW